MVPFPFVAKLIFTLYSRRLSIQQETYAHFKRFMVGDWSFLQEESFCASCAFRSHCSLDDSSNTCLCRCLTLGRTRKYNHATRVI